jgi:hypothetical protein
VTASGKLVRSPNSAIFCAHTVSSTVPALSMKALYLSLFTAHNLSSYHLRDLLNLQVTTSKQYASLVANT